MRQKLLCVKAFYFLFILAVLVVSVVQCSFVPWTWVTVITYQWPNSWTGPASQLKSEPKQMLYFVKI